uniref:DUF4220 domain-containing protein n=7 Tax=Aegilops tauschii subsp. strangulata TaxID=200361 RepID=A0A453T8E7_AEGTS
MGETGAPMPSWMELWNEWEIQAVVVASFSLQVILFFFAGIRRYSTSSVLKALLWLVYLSADVVATYALGNMSSSLTKKSSGEHQLVAFWAPFLLLHLGGQDTITAYALEDNELWRRHLLNMFLQVAGTAYVLYKYIIAGGATFIPAAMLVLAYQVRREDMGTEVCKQGFQRAKWLCSLCRKEERKFCYLCRKEERKLCPLCHKEKKISRVVKYIFFCFITMPGQDTETNLGDFEGPMQSVDETIVDCFTKHKQFGIYAFIVMTAHALRYALVKPLIIDRNEAFIDWSGTTIGLLNGHAEEYPRELYKAILRSCTRQ